MNELHLQDRFLIPFFREGLGYNEVKANTITNSLIIEEDLLSFISETELNKKPYEILLRKYRGDEKKLLKELIELIQERISSSRNMALFINANKSITLNGVKLKSYFTRATALFMVIDYLKKIFFQWYRNYHINTIIKGTKYFHSVPILFFLLTAFILATAN